MTSLHLMSDVQKNLTISYSTSTVPIQTAEDNATAVFAESITQTNDMQADIK